MKLIDADALLAGLYDEAPKDVALYIANFPEASCMNSEKMHDTDDLISRQAAMKLLQDDWQASESRGDDERAEIAKWHYIGISNLPSAQPERTGKWIPCSERLPEEGRYLVNCSLSVFSPQVMNYSDGEWYYDGCQSMDLEIPTINAWMPLPEPYKEEQS